MRGHRTGGPGRRAIPGGDQTQPGAGAAGGVDRAAVRLCVSRRDSERPPFLVTLPLFTDFLQPLLQVLFVFMLERGVARRTVNLAGLVLTFVEFLTRPFVVNVDYVRVVDHLSH